MTPSLNLFRFVFTVSMILALTFGALFAGHISSAQEITAAERAALEEELKRLEYEIKLNEDKAREYRGRGNTLTAEIGSLDSKIAKLNAQIQYINATLSRLNRDIAENEVGITTTEQKIDRQKAAIGKALQTMYEQEQISLVAIMLKSPNLSDFFDDLNRLMVVQSRLTTTVQEVTALKNDLLAKKEDLSAQKTEASTFRSFQESQKKEVASTKEEKKEILAVTKGKESEYQRLAEARKAEAAKIRSRLFQLLGGGEMTFQQAYDFAKFAGDATGVTPSLLLAILDRESSLGANVGRCTYDQNPYYPAEADNPTTMHPTRDIPSFLEITKSLGLDPATTQVSCPLPWDGAYGGAIGPGQFLPSTWVLYRERIAGITGSTPNPWRNSDAFVGTALYMQDAMSACGREYSGDTQIRCAAARYYAGGNYKKHMYATYGTATLARKNQFDADIAVITQN